MKIPDCPLRGDPMTLHRERDAALICIVCDHPMPASQSCRRCDLKGRDLLRWRLPNLERTVMVELSDQVIAEAIATLRSEGDRFPEYPALKSIAGQMEQLWEAIKSGDQGRINAIGRPLMVAAQALPITESKQIWDTRPVLDKLLSHVQIGRHCVFGNVALWRCLPKPCLARSIGARCGKTRRAVRQNRRAAV